MFKVHVSIINLIWRNHGLGYHHKNTHKGDITWQDRRQRVARVSDSFKTDSGFYRNHIIPSNHSANDLMTHTPPPTKPCLLRVPLSRLLSLLYWRSNFQHTYTLHNAQQHLAVYDESCVEAHYGVSNISGHQHVQGRSLIHCGKFPGLQSSWNLCGVREGYHEGQISSGLPCITAKGFGFCFQVGVLDTH